MHMADGGAEDGAEREEKEEGYGFDGDGKR